MGAAASNDCSKPHLALVTANPLRTGGMQAFTRHLLEMICSANWRVTIALSGEDIYSDRVWRGIGGCDVEHVDWVDHTLAGDRAYRLRAIMDRRRWFRRVRPGVALFVQSSNTPFRASIVGAWLARVPIVMTHRTMPWVKDFTPCGRHLFGLVPGFGLHNRRQVLKTWLTAVLADRIVYNSDEVRRCYEHDYRYPRRKGRAIVNAVQAPAAAGSHRSHSDEITIGYVGRLADEKRIDVLIRAIATLKTPRHVRLLVYGEGPQQAPLAVLADELGIADRVQWCGPTDDVWSAYKRMDVVALCSRRESSSNMVLEAMGAGKAVVVTDVGGLGGLTGHGGWGLCVPAGDVSALAAALDELIDNDDARMELGTRAREVARARHDPRAVGRAWLDLLTEVAGRRAARPAARRHESPMKPAVLSSEPFDGLSAGQY